MRPNKSWFFLSAGILLFSGMVNCQEAGAASKFPPDFSITGRNKLGAWVSGSPYQFQPEAYSRETPALKQYFVNDDVKERKHPGGRENRLKMLEQYSLFRKISSTREKLLEKFGLDKQNTKEGLVFPMLMGERQGNDRMSRPDRKDAFQSKPEEGRPKEGNQERYLIGYRFNRKGVDNPQTWVLGFGWKNGGPKKPREDSRDSRDSNQAAVKKDFSGPILGIMGEY